MGLSSSKTKTTTNQNTSQQETTSGTQMPVTPSWLTDVARDYVGRIGDFGDMDPNSFVAPASPLQQMAWQNVGNLSGWQGQARTAAELAQQAGQAGANFAGKPVGSVPAGTGGQMGPPSTIQGGGGAFTAQAAQLGPAAQVGAQGYGAPVISAPPLVSGTGYQAPTIANAQGYAAARTGQPIGAQAQGYGESQVSTPTVGATTNATASNADPASLLQNLSSYQSPYTNDVVNASLAQFDQGVQQQQAALAAQQARTGAFGGSRAGIAQGQLAADAALGRGSLAANLRDQGFRTAAGLSQSDAANRQQAGLFNAQNQTGVRLQNANAANQRALAQAGVEMQSGLANMDARNQASQFGAAAQNQANLFNADQQGRFTLDQAARLDQAGQYNAGANNQFALAEAGLQNDAARFGAEQGMAAQLANQAAQQQRNLAQAGMVADSSRYNADATNVMFARNQDAQNQFALQQGLFGQQTGLANAAARNQMSQFNAGQGDAAQARALQAAQLLGGLASDYGAGTRADLGLMAQLGDQQRGIEQAYAMAPLAQLQMMGNLSGMTPYDILVGRQTEMTGSSSGTMQGTNVTSQSPSLFSQLLAAGNLAASFIK